ncbi:MAG TPA: hypothetical protein PKC21_03805 [Oligoflexia bacterium]|nr:hypothetical protein [Oligoflexia bacterium]HMR24462.1 hypothetical protein [Oligoflexia bacterium]
MVYFYKITLLNIIFAITLGMAQGPTIVTEQLPTSVRHELAELELRQKKYEKHCQVLDEEEEVFKHYHRAIKKLKDASDIVSTIKLNHQYQIFQAQAKSLEELRNKKKLAKQALEEQRDALLESIDLQLNDSKRAQVKAKDVTQGQVKILTALYERYSKKDIGLNHEEPIAIPDDLDPESVLALEDLLAGMNKKIAMVESSLKNIRRKQFINTSLMDTLEEESFFSESQFIHSGNQDRSDVFGVNALNGSGNNQQNPGNNPETPDTLLNDSSQRDISSIEAKRLTQKQNFSQNDALLNQSIEALESKLIFLQAERLKILNELNKQ